MAGFGFSVSDIVTLSSLAWTVYKRCKNAGDEFRSITGDVQSLQAALHLLVDEMDNPNSLIHRSTPAQKQELEQLMQSCTSDLQILEKILAKYSSLRTPDPRFRHKLSFTADRQADIGKKLGGCYQKLDLFLTQLHSGSLARIETNGERNTELLCGIEAKLHAIYEHVLTEAKDPSQLSILDDWDFLQKELVDDNITEIDVKDNRDEITEWVSSLRAGDANRSEKMSSAFTRTDYEIQNPEQSTRTTREDQLESSDSSGDHGYVIRTVSSSSRLYPRIRDEGPNQFHGESRENNEFRKGKHKSRTGNFAGKDYPLSSLVNSTTDTRGSSPSQDSGHASTGSFEARPAMPILAHSTRGSSSRPILASHKSQKANGKRQGTRFMESFWDPGRTQPRIRQDTTAPTALEDDSPPSKVPPLTSPLKQNRTEGLHIIEIQPEELERRTIEKLIPFTLEEVFHGCSKRVQIRKHFHEESTGLLTFDEYVAEIKLAKGTQDGSKLPSYSLGSKGQSIVFIVQELPHPIFRRYGDLLELTLRVGLDEILQGWNRRIERFGGTRRVSASRPTSMCFELPNFGMPKQTQPLKFGNMRVLLEVDFPQALDWTEAQQQWLLDKLSQSRRQVKGSSA